MERVAEKYMCKTEEGALAKATSRAWLDYCNAEHDFILHILDITESIYEPKRIEIKDLDRISNALYSETPVTRPRFIRHVAAFNTSELDAIRSDLDELKSLHRKYFDCEMALFKKTKDSRFHDAFGFSEKLYQKAIDSYSLPFRVAQLHENAEQVVINSSNAHVSNLLVNRARKMVMVCEFALEHKKTSEFINEPSERLKHSLDSKDPDMVGIHAFVEIDRLGLDAKIQFKDAKEDGSTLQIFVDSKKLHDHVGAKKITQRYFSGTQYVADVSPKNGKSYKTQFGFLLVPDGCEVFEALPRKKRKDALENRCERIVLTRAMSDNKIQLWAEPL